MMSRSLCRLLATSILLSTPALVPRHGSAAEPPALLVSAWVATAGPYGEDWDLTIRQDGGAALQVLYMGSPSGTLMAHVRLSEDAIGRIRAALASERFFDLATKLAPKASPLHMPHLKLDIWSGEEHRVVTVYDPGPIMQEPATQRFLKVWDAVYSGFPLRPTWEKGRITTR
jgi:hypothetical protein